MSLPIQPNPLQEPAPEAGRPSEDARARLLQAGLHLFAQQGYSKTSTRELAEAASVNVASISYYFGDKAGLYRAVFIEPMGSPEADLARFNGTDLTLTQVLRGFYDSFLEPLRRGDEARLCMKLHFREMLEPTGLCELGITDGIRPLHEALLDQLCRHFKLKGPDTDLQRLAICLAGLGVHMHVGRDISDALVPGINDGAQALDTWSERLVLFGLAMVRAEAARRGMDSAGLD